MKNVIEVKNLSKTFVTKHKESGLKGSFKFFLSNKKNFVKAVQNISFTIQQGEMMGFIGPNGAGKTTTLKMLSGILYPSSGEVSVLGYTPFERKHEFLKQISLVMGQKNQLLWDLPAIDSFNLNREIYEIDKAQYKKLLNELVDLFGIEDILHQQVRRLSLGQRMKCELVASLLHNPKILFLDEPTLGLDIVIQKKLRTLIKDLNQKFGTTIILTSHYMGDVKEIANRVIIINKGQLIFDDSIQKLINNYVPYKEISLVLNKKPDQKTISKIEGVIEYNFPELLIRVDPSAIANTTQALLTSLDVDDIDIKEPDLEDIVMQIFEK